MQPHSPACHRHAMELPETVFINVPCSIIFLIFSFSPFFIFFLVFKKKNLNLWIQFRLYGSTIAIEGPYQYKNRGQNFPLAERAAPWHGNGMRVGGAAFKTPMEFDVYLKKLVWVLHFRTF